MKIMNVGAEEIRACCVVQYKGYEISMSTILTHGSIEVNKIGESDYARISTFENAIAYIENKQPVKPKGELTLVIYKDSTDSSQIGGYYFVCDQHHMDHATLIQQGYTLNMRNYFKLCEQAEREMDSDHDYLKVCLDDLYTLMTNNKFIPEPE